MYKICINSIEPYGGTIPKILAHCSAYWCEQIVPVPEQISGEGGEVVTVLDEGQPLYPSPFDIALDAGIVYGILSQAESSEAAKVALNQFVIQQAQLNEPMKMETLRARKARLDAEAAARATAQAMIDAVSPLVIFPARIDPEHPEVIQPQPGE